MSVYYDDAWWPSTTGRPSRCWPQSRRAAWSCGHQPAYNGPRDYGVPGQIGTEATPAGFVAAVRAVFGEEMGYSLTDGTLWLVLGDVYSSSDRAESTWLAGR